MDADNAKRIGQRINAALVKADKKQKELAAHLGVKDNVVSYFCNGARTPNIEQIIEIAKFLGVSSDYLLGISDVSSAETTVQAICEYTGLNDSAVAILNGLSYWCHDDKTDCINYLISQEEPHPLAEYPEYFIEGVDVPQWLTDAENRWERKQLAPILSLVWDYIRFSPTEDSFHIDALGNIEKVNRDAKGLAMFKGMSFDGLRRIQGQEIIEQVLLSKITESLKKLRTRYLQSEV